ncbi:MAG: 3'(2'),5'-bisphosphate nucleotidase [Anaerolineaceae bacterium]|nr:3'(2'),5'-bisphosphate nucleotidase [Anaerolineaceae bacterium]
MTDLQPIIQAARQAAALCSAVQQKHIAPYQDGSNENVASKAGAEPVTIADYGAQAIICRALSQAFPEDGVIAEEGSEQFRALITAADQQEVADLIGGVLGETVTIDQVIGWLDHGLNRDSDRLWVIDPIDGTKGFIALRQYVVAIGVLDSHKRVVDGVMAAPGYLHGSAVFYTQDGAALVEAMNGGPARKLQASQRTDPSTLIALESFEKSHASQDLMGDLREAAGIGSAQIERIDSQEKYARVAAGDADLYLRLPRITSTRPHMIWDHAAGTALVEAAGGIVSDVDGSPLDFSHGRTLATNKGMIVANPRIHPRLIEAARQLELA